MEPQYTAYTVISGISLILILLPLPWHFGARNYGTLLYIAWTFVGNLIFFVNSIIWRGNMGNPAPIWCDITAKLQIGLGVALPAVSLCINRRLYSIATMKGGASSPKERRNQALIDCGIALGLPIILMALHYVVQGHRYDIVENIGCFPTTYVTPLVVPLVAMWPPLLGCISCIYCVLSIRAFLKQRRTFSSMLSSGSNPHINTSRYLRLIALAGTEILFDLPLSTFILWLNLRDGFNPWISWADTHYNFSYVGYIPMDFLKSSRPAYAAVEINRWTLPTAAVLFFLYFGLAGESLACYKTAAARTCSFLRDTTARCRAGVSSILQRRKSLPSDGDVLPSAPSTPSADIEKPKRAFPSRPSISKSNWDRESLENVDLESAYDYEKERAFERDFDLEDVGEYVTLPSRPTTMTPHPVIPHHLAFPSEYPSPTSFDSRLSSTIVPDSSSFSPTSFTSHFDKPTIFK